MNLQQNQLTIPVNRNTTIEELLKSFHLSKKQRYFLCMERRIKVNTCLITQSTPLQPGDQVIIDLKQEADTIPAWNHPISIVYEDDVLLIVDKPSGLLVHSDGINTQHTLCNAVKAYYDHSHQQTLVRPLHRLDVDTSGLILFCKQPFFQALLDEQLSNKLIHREYQAICYGVMEKSFWDIHKSIARDRHDAKKMRIDANGKEARTQIKVMTQYKQHALVSCRLFTGRTHQIRVHLSSIHHPILSDPLYGKKDPRISRCALHAFQLTLQHPLTNETMTVTTDLPQDMKSLLR